MPKVRVKLKGSQWYLDGVATPLFVFALTQQAVSFHIVARHWHGLHYMETVTGKHVLELDISAQHQTGGIAFIGKVLVSNMEPFPSMTFTPFPSMGFLLGNTLHM